ncbi:MAG TPA: hypothetical protein PLL32_00575 [Anaeromyxobacteraceae bacterium]|nr:hypothetical protein [Anaeromyxobacteraceae bacterium]
MRIKALFSLAVLAFAGVALAQAPAQTTVVEEKKSETVTVVVKETPKPPAFVFELHGFVSTTMFFQNTSFGVGSGQNALFVNKRYDADQPIFGGDIRQTRLNFSVRGPQVLGGATPKAVVEFDMFGSSEFQATGSYGDVSIIPRIRVAYAELNWGNHIIQIGQQNMLTIGIIPESLSHIAFPATYAAGTVGWRQPGFWGWHTFGDDLKFEFAWSVQKSGWANNQVANTTPPSTPSTQTVYDGLNAGFTSGLPAFEARGKLTFNKNWDVWISGHWQTVDRNGAGVIAQSSQWTDLQTILGTVGFKGTLGPVALRGSAWYGKNAAPLLGNIIQFPPANYLGDIFGWGAWGQGGFNLTKNWSGWYTFGIDMPSFNDIWAASKVTGSGVQYFKNMNQMFMIRYMDGGFAIGAEYLYSRTYSVRDANAPLIGNQISITGNYYF